MTESDQPIAGGNQPVSDNLSFEELIAQRVSKLTPQEEPQSEPEDELQEQDDEDASQEDDQEVESDAEESDDEDEGETEGDEVDLLNLSPEQIQELAKKGKSRLLQRIGELTAKNKALEEQLKVPQQQGVKEIQESEMPDWVRGLDSHDKIKAKYAELEKTMEVTDTLLEEYEDYGPDDVVIVDGQEFTKKQIRKANRNAREALTKLLPAQAQNIAKVEQFKVLGEQYKEAARKEVPEINDEESEIGKNYNALLQDPLVDRLRVQIPELGMQIEYILAHAARSIFGSKKKSLPSGAGTKLKASPPASPVGAGAAKKTKTQGAKVQEAFGRFEKTGSTDDWIRARTAKLSKL